MGRLLSLVLVMLALALAGCGSVAESLGSQPDATATATPASGACPVTQPPDPPFVPPAPYPAEPPGADSAWYGSAARWTTVIADGPHDSSAFFKDVLVARRL